MSIEEEASAQSESILILNSILFDETYDFASPSISFLRLLNY
ncbi:hypothetical protein PL9214480051 [Planktothrix tepida PCC 9214]|uniref:Uncharacterized protein n=2 Tax=Planktothrix TaxID=54304 RepID=A0A1J1LIW6_9CYAN|nr:hypothetical protein NO713_03390 [Planktothrix pseudagardhii]CUR32443.1 hypothetical protein PL9214480051 [Planktothrix tepida PCC 9214]